MGHKVLILHILLAYYRVAESPTTGPKGLAFIKCINCPHISWKAGDLPFIAKVNFSSARQLDNSLSHCLMSGLSGFFQNKAIFHFAQEKHFIGEVGG